MMLLLKMMMMSMMIMMMMMIIIIIIITIKLRNAQTDESGKCQKLQIVLLYSIKTFHTFDRMTYTE